MVLHPRCSSLHYTGNASLSSAGKKKLEIEMVFDKVLLGATRKGGPAQWVQYLDNNLPTAWQVREVLVQKVAIYDNRNS